jgi:hypothetical protein
MIKTKIESEKYNKTKLSAFSLRYKKKTKYVIALQIIKVIQDSLV